MLSKAKHLLFLLLAALVLSSCVSIEKRRYMDGFYVERTIFHKKKQQEVFTQNSQSIRIESQRNSDSAFSANISAPLASRNDAVNIFTEGGAVPQLNKIVFKEDTLPKKKQKHGNFKDDEKKNTYNHNRKTNVFAILGLVMSVVALIYLPAEIIAFIVSLIGLRQIEKHPDKYDGRTLALLGAIISGVIVGMFGLLYLYGLLL